MMLALALVAVLAQLAMPSYTALSKDLQGAAAAQQLLQDLRSARSQALLQQQAVRVEPLEADWGLGWRVLDADSGRLLTKQRLPQRVRIVGNLADGVRFSEQGVPLRGSGGFHGGSLQICPHAEGGQLRQIVLAPSGRVRLRTDMAIEPLCAGP
ncbi:GspH/FimT family protein [Pseudomonas shirazensis]|uniref:GspH/FimT family protein n=1 Tax=Pseudomonas shirazensis TaxID=2745494 RepID=UPI003D2A0C3B